MRHYRFSIPAALLGVFSLFTFPLPTYAAGLFKQIVPTSGTCACPGTAMDWGCALQVIQAVLNDAIGIGVLMAVMWIAYTGFSLMTSGPSAETRTMFRTRITNIVVGVAVMLAAWLVVDFVMKAIYNPDTIYQATIFGPWNDILAPNGDDYCIKETTPVAIFSGTVGIMTTVTPGTSATFSSGTGTGACNPSQVASAASSGGYTISANEANILACLAKPESACGANTTGAKTTSGAATSAAGPWQILLGASDKCHSLNLPACGNLNCSAAYSGGRVKSDAASQALAAKCQQAVNNLGCSAAAAACIVQASGGKYSAWTADSRSSTQKACVTANGGSY